MKTFQEDFFMLFNLLEKKIKFSFSKYADGEYAILVNQLITNCDNWTFNPETDGKYRDELLDSFRFNELGYYVGISCPCCVPKEHVQWMRDNVGVDDNHLTWANIFVNGNYNNFLKYFIPEFAKHDVILIAAESGKANVKNLPFKVEEYIPIGKTAWKENFNLVEELPKKEYNDKLFLLCAGPLGNMLAAKMWKYNKNNIYMDIGSTLNPWLVGANRGYLCGSETLNKICIW
jgi:hypothetical protein